MPIKIIWFGLPSYCCISLLVLVCIHFNILLSTVPGGTCIAFWWNIIQNIEKVFVNIWSHKMTNRPIQLLKTGIIKYLHQPKRWEYNRDLFVKFSV